MTSPLPLQLPSVTPPPKLTGRNEVNRGDHLSVLVVCIGVVVLAALLTIRPDGRVAFGFFPSWPVPETCPAWRILHVRCPGCGLTRSIICLAHGHWNMSLHYHRLGWAVAIAILMQIPYRILCIQRGSCPGLNAKDTQWIGYALFAGLIMNWCLDFF
jgi:hypothetical protein